MKQTTLDYKLPIFRCCLVREGTQRIEDRECFRSPADAAKVFGEYLAGADREIFAVLFADTKNRLIGIHTVSIGILDSALVHPAQVFKPALLCNAASVLLCHNHPSGCCEPSPEDRHITKRICDAGTLLGIEVLDHIVLGEFGKFCSLKERGYM